MMQKKWQKEFCDRFKAEKNVALFGEIGCGKTRATLDLLREWQGAFGITGAVVVAPKGVHRQWVEHAVPEHAPDFLAFSCGDLNVPANNKSFILYSINFDALNSVKFLKEMREIFKTHLKVALVIDECHKVKNKSTSRWKNVFELRKKCSHFVMLSGTPIAKNNLDYWAEYYIMDYNIIGEKYATGFKNRFCQMGGFKAKQVVGAKNEDELKKLVAPYTFRIKNEDNPTVLTKDFEFNMDSEQKKAFSNYKQSFVLDLQDVGSEAQRNPGVGLIRLQQITSGYFPTEEGAIFFKNPRLECLHDIIDAYIQDEKAVIWAHFHYDVEEIMKSLGQSAIDYYGQTKDRPRNKEIFMNDKDVRFLVASPAAGGTGIDGLQKVANKAIFYSHSFSFVDRLQAEGRLIRTGQENGHVTNFNIICKGGIDKMIFRNLGQKKGLSDYMLDGIISELKEI